MCLVGNYNLHSLMTTSFWCLELGASVFSSVWSRTVVAGVVAGEEDDSLDDVSAGNRKHVSVTKFGKRHTESHGCRILKSYKFI